jgi:queuosine precursor transporter
VKYVTTACFIATVYAANWMLTHYGVWSIGALLVPAGTLFAGLGFLLRCCLQEVASRAWVLGAILCGALLSLWLGASVTIPGGHVQVAVASACAFGFSELADWSTYTPLRRRTIVGGLSAAQAVGAIVDTTLFLFLAFGSFTWNLWVGQFLGKTLMVVPAVCLVAAYRRAPSGETPE